MPYAKLRTELLQVREQRELRRVQTGQHLEQSLVQLSLNIPGPEKLPPGAENLFGWGLRQVLELLPLVESCSHGHDLLGPWALLGTCQNSVQMKRQAVALEKAAPACRLLDIDVYDPQGRQIGRSELGLPARPCLLCARPAVDCIRLQNHSPADLKVRIDELLTPFRA